MFDGKKKTTDEEMNYTEDVPESGSIGGEAKQGEDVTDETMVEDSEEEETNQTE